MREDEPKLWTFSLAVYNDPAVQKECLDLQDEYGMNVNVLLFCAFVGAVYGAVLSDQAMKAASEAVGAWQKEVVIPLRRARRALKPFTTTSPLASQAVRLRSGVKAIELEAEKLEQTLLERWCAAHIDAWPRVRPASAVVDNIRTLFSISAGSPQPGLPRHLIAAALTASGH